MFALLAVFVAETLHWPLVGDAVSVHYLILLMQHGMAPYRQIVDTQMPGTYLYDWLVLRLFGGSAAGLRMFDFSLTAGAMVAMIAMAWPVDNGSGLSKGADHRPAAFLAGGLFAILHGRDGILQAGQRDLVMAVLLLAAYACTFHALRRNRPWLSLAAGFCAAAAISIKPTILPAALIVFPLALSHLRRKRQACAGHLLATLAGLALPLLAVFAFLVRHGAMPAFLNALHDMWPFYATLDRHSLGYLLGHSLSRTAPLVALWLLVLLLQATPWKTTTRKTTSDGRRWERGALYAGMGLALTSFLVQGKGYPYHRYPFLALLTLVIMLDFSRALQAASARLELRIAGALGLLVAVACLGPLSLYKISAFDWRNDDYYKQMSADLNRLGGSQLSGHVQCLDAFSGCIMTLDRMGLVQSTGFLVDFYLFSRRTSPVIASMRQQFRDAVESNPPRVFIVTKQIFPATFSSTGVPLDTYEKLQRWPLFDAYLQQHYSLIEEHDWSRPVLWGSHAEHPAGYRIYLHHP